MEELCNKALELYNDFISSLPNNGWFMKQDFFRHSEDLMFEAYCEGWLSYGLKFITEFDHIILLISRYGGGECGAYSLDWDPENEIKEAIENWLETWEIDDDSINFEFIHIDD